MERRLYKLYDFRLPVPVPVGQIAVYAAITVPYVVLLTVLGLPFNHTLFWLYVLTPVAIPWLAARPVLESKRLPELLISQVRYLGEPATWCRMAPLAKQDEIVVVGRVWWRDNDERRPVGRQSKQEMRPPRTRPTGTPGPGAAGRPSSGHPARLGDDVGLAGRAGPRGTGRPFDRGRQRGQQAQHDACGAGRTCRPQPMPRHRPDPLGRSSGRVVGRSGRRGTVTPAGGWCVQVRPAVAVGASRVHRAGGVLVAALPPRLAQRQAWR